MPNMQRSNKQSDMYQLPGTGTPELGKGSGQKISYGNQKTKEFAGCVWPGRRKMHKMQCWNEHMLALFFDRGA